MSFPHTGLRKLTQKDSKDTREITHLKKVIHGLTDVIELTNESNEDPGFEKLSSACNHLSRTLKEGEGKMIGVRDTTNQGMKKGENHILFYRSGIAYFKRIVQNLAELRFQGSDMNSVLKTINIKRGKEDYAERITYVSPKGLRQSSDKAIIFSIREEEEGEGEKKKDLMKKQPPYVVKYARPFQKWELTYELRMDRNMNNAQLVIWGYLNNDGWEPIKDTTITFVTETPFQFKAKLYEYSSGEKRVHYEEEEEEEEGMMMMMERKTMSSRTMFQKRRLSSKRGDIGGKSGIMTAYSLDNVTLQKDESAKFALDVIKGKGKGGKDKITVQQWLVFKDGDDHPKRAVSVHSDELAFSDDGVMVIYVDDNQIGEAKMSAIRKGEENLAPYAFEKQVIVTSKTKPLLPTFISPNIDGVIVRYVLRKNRQLVFRITDTRDKENLSDGEKFRLIVHNSWNQKAGTPEVIGAKFVGLLEDGQKRTYDFVLNKKSAKISFIEYSDSKKSFLMSNKNEYEEVMKNSELVKALGGQGKIIAARRLIK
ncbi:MAG: hypothetical protein ACTSUE_13935 [Promethearchaeota archaeon]